MGANTKIEWADHTWNPWWGCTKVSVGDKGACEFCYAEPLAHRFGVPWGNAPRKKAGPKHLALPYQWQRAALKANTRPFVFCASMADIFDNQVPPEWRAEAFQIMRECDRLVWLLLTKRPSMIEKLSAEAGGLPPNAAIGASIVTQKEADRDVLTLLDAKRALRPAFAFVSCEPLMGAVDLSRVEAVPNSYDERGRLKRCGIRINTLTDQVYFESGVRYPGEGLDWVIAGGESGPKARPSHPEWFRWLRDQCATAGTPFLFKQWGEWHPSADHDPATCPFKSTHAIHISGEREFRPLEAFAKAHANGWAGVCEVGKKRAGRLLDGVEHNEFPACFANADGRK